MKIWDSWQALAFASALFAGLTAIFGKIGVAGVNSNLATLIRTVVIIVVLALIVTWRNEWQPLASISKHTWIFLTLSALATGASWICYYRALQTGPASRVAPIDKMSVVVAMVLAAIFLKETFTWKAILGGIMVAAGALLLAIA